MHCHGSIPVCNARLSAYAGVPHKKALRLSDAWDFGKHSQIRLAPAAVPERATYPDGCLLHRLQAAGNVHTSASMPPGKLCFTEHELVIQVRIKLCIPLCEAV